MNVGISILILIGLHSCKTSKKDISYLKESIEPPSTFIATNLIIKQTQSSQTQLLWAI